MVGPEHLDRDYLESVRKLRPTHPCFLVHIGLRDTPIEMLREAEGYYWDSWDADQFGSGVFKVFVPTLFEPAMAPPGGQIVIVQKVTDIDYPSMEDWAFHKSTVEDQIMANLERIMPGFSKKVVVATSASALTSYKYTLNHRGAMLGWEMAPDQLGECRPGITGPVKNLYFTGHWTQPGGGVTPVIISAMQAAKAIMEATRN